MLEILNGSWGNETNWMPSLDYCSNDKSTATSFNLSHKNMVFSNWGTSIVTIKKFNIDIYYTN